MFLCIKSRQSIIMDRIRRLEITSNFLSESICEYTELYNFLEREDPFDSINAHRVTMYKMLVQKFTVDKSCADRAINRMYKIYSQQLKKK